VQNSRKSRMGCMWHLFSSVGFNTDIELQLQRFLAAALQIESLKICTSINNLRKAVKSLPSDLDDIYRSTLKRIKTQTEEDISLAARAITLLTHAYRTLEITELQHALGVPYNNTETFNDGDVVDEGAIVSVCCGLIVVDKESETVRLVREYSC